MDSPNNNNLFLPAHSLCKRDRIMVKKEANLVCEEERNDERLLAEDLFVYLIYLWQSGERY
jgi:hypothetical protein